MVSYYKSSNAIVTNYKKSSLQSIEMTGEYIRFGLDSVEATGLQYIMDVDIKKYFNGMYASKPLEANTVMQDIKENLLAKQLSDSFIENTHILSDTTFTMTTANKAEKEMYGAFLETKTGSGLVTKSNAKYWVGQDEYLDEKFTLASKEYAIRYVQGFADAKACIVIDISAVTIQEILDGLDFWASAFVVRITFI